jgi:Barstar (barnase inhibitor)
MDVNKLVTPGQPTFYVTTIEESKLEDLRLHLTFNYPGLVTRILRGSKSRTVESFFDEVGAALQFPYYFGENWPAFAECLTDLGWLPGDAYLLLIQQANFLLREAPEDFGTLIRILDRASREWLIPNQYIPRNLPATAFHIIFQCIEGDVSEFTKRLAEADTDSNIESL